MTMNKVIVQCISRKYFPGIPKGHFYTSISLMVLKHYVLLPHTKKGPAPG